jgi:hypothetical protein
MAAASRYQAICARLESIIGQDIGSRGIGHLFVPGDLAAAGLALVRARSVVVLTGFPCRITATPPTETDGPSGAVAIALASVRLGKRTAVATDDSSAEVVRATAAAVGLSPTPSTTTAARAFELLSFPPRSGWDEAVHTPMLASAIERYDHCVAIERAGAASDGAWYTMRGKSMAHLVAPIDAMLVQGTRAEVAGRDGGVASLPPLESASGGGAGASPSPSSYPRTSTGIGDGGNECGMGKVAERVRKHINNGQLIACVTPADNLITAGVSNWGGWGLVAAAEAALRCGLAPPGIPSAADASEEPRNRSHLPPVLADGIVSGSVPPGALLVTTDEDDALVAAMNACGAGDGITGATDGSVDGLPPSAHHGVLEAVRKVLREEF